MIKLSAVGSLQTNESHSDCYKSSSSCWTALLEHLKEFCLSNKNQIFFFITKVGGNVETMLQLLQSVETREYHTRLTTTLRVVNNEQSRVLGYIMIMARQRWTSITASSFSFFQVMSSILVVRQTSRIKWTAFLSSLSPWHLNSLSVDRWQSDTKAIEIRIIYHNVIQQLKRYSNIRHRI